MLRFSSRVGGRAGTGLVLLTLLWPVHGCSERLPLVPEAPPAVTLALAVDGVQLRLGESATVNATVTRTSFTGPVDLRAENVPTGITIPNVTIPAGSTTAELKIGVQPTGSIGSAQLAIRASADGVTSVLAPLTISVAAASIAIVPAVITITELGQEVPLTVLLNEQPAVFHLSTRSELRWLDDRAVLDGPAMADNRLVARAPGRAIVSVQVAGHTDSVVVHVTPATPVIFELLLPADRIHLGEADTIVLRGYAMGALQADNITGADVTVLPGDSAHARMVLSPLPAGACGGVASVLQLGFSGVAGPPLPALTRQRAGELALAVAEAVRLSSASAACIRFAPAADARYLLAYADSRLVAQAQTEPEWPGPDSILVTVADRSQPLQAGAEGSRLLAGTILTAMSAAPPPDRSARSESNAELPSTCSSQSLSVFCRATPYTLGEVFSYVGPGTTDRHPGLARVVAVSDNFAAALWLPDSAWFGPAESARLDSALAFMDERATPLLQDSWNVSGPTRTSDPSGQLFINLRAAQYSSAGWFADPVAGHGRWAHMVLGMGPNAALGDPNSTAARVVGITAHELLHTYQFRWRFEHGGPWVNSLGTLWGIEGAASFFSRELVREYMGEPFLGNLSNIAGGLYWFLMHDFTGGYATTASFMRYLLQRLVTDGNVPFDEAMAEIMVGSIEGWWGINEEGLARGPGLAPRMRDVLGAHWHPVEALLDWTMSEAADDLTTNPRFQNLTLRTNPNSPTFPPHATVTGGSLSIMRAPGNTGVWAIEDSAGGTYEATGRVGAAPSEALEWLILRVR
jgi:hypothetical protein